MGVTNYLLTGMILQVVGWLASWLVFVVLECNDVMSTSGVYNIDFYICVLVGWDLENSNWDEDFAGSITI